MLEIVWRGVEGAGEFGAACPIAPSGETGEFIVQQRWVNGLDPIVVCSQKVGCLSLRVNTDEICLLAPRASRGGLITLCLFFMVLVRGDLKFAYPE